MKTSLTEEQIEAIKKLAPINFQNIIDFANGGEEQEETSSAEREVPEDGEE